MRIIPENHYKPHESLKGFVCWYCEEDGTTEDHFPPISKVAECMGISAWIVRACLSCNAILGNRMFIDIAQRKLFMIRYLERKVKAQYLLLDGHSVAKVAALFDLAEDTVARFRDDAQRVILRRYKWMETPSLIETVLESRDAFIPW